MKRIAKPSQLKSGVRYLRVCLNHHGDFLLDTFTPIGAQMAFDKYKKKHSIDNPIKGDPCISKSLVVTDKESYCYRQLKLGIKQQSHSSPYRFLGDLFNGNVYRFNARTETFFTNLSKNKRHLWTYLTGKSSDKDWEEQNSRWEDSKSFDKALWDSLDEPYYD